MNKSYGFTLNQNILSEQERVLEDLSRKGFALIDSGLSGSDIAYANQSLESIYKAQETAFGRSTLETISELDMARSPLISDKFFLEKIALNSRVLSVTKTQIDGAFQLHLQNGIINRPSTIHHQSNWHRDLPYQNWVCSKTLAISAFFCLCDFTSENGATYFLPYSHLFDVAPSQEFIEKNKVQAIAKAGTVILFNSMVLHCAGSNTSNFTRIGINNMYTIPLIKQQIDLTDDLLNNFPDLTKENADILGITYASPKSVDQWRSARIKKKDLK